MRKVTSPHTVSAKHIAMRTCVACRKIQAKREMLRLVNTLDGNIEIDISGKKDGRGAYLCRDWNCWETGLKSSRLEHALRGSLTKDNHDQLIKQASEILKGAV